MGGPPALRECMCLAWNRSSPNHCGSVKGGISTTHSRSAEEMWRLRGEATCPRTHRWTAASETASLCGMAPPRAPASAAPEGHSVLDALQAQWAGDCCRKQCGPSLLPR